MNTYKTEALPIYIPSEDLSTLQKLQKAGALYPLNIWVYKLIRDYASLYSAKI